ncbi:putative leucine-rich repeat domain superfamily [Arabidopsis thaliana]|nr:Leucine-rich repeat [Arabidopsis thaliana x Arabidopsis arenosa]
MWLFCMFCHKPVHFILPLLLLLSSVFCPLSLFSGCGRLYLVKHNLKTSAAIFNSGRHIGGFDCGRIKKCFLFFRRRFFFYIHRFGALATSNRLRLISKMKILPCFGFIRRKKNKGNSKPQKTQRILQIRLEEPVKPLENDEPNNKDSPIKHESYDGEDERDDKDSTNREFSKFHVHERAVESVKSKEEVTDTSENGDDNDEDEGGHVSDPGLGKTTAWVTSPKLKRSCSTLSKFNGRFHGSDLHDLKETVPVSNESVRSHRSADRVMLKKHSSMQILPSGSRRLWWKLFLWSHRNLHKHRVSQKSQPLNKNHQSGYTSDFAEHNQSSHEEESTNYCADFTNQSSNLWPHHNQWVAFSAESSSMKRVDEWVRGLDVETVVPVNEDKDVLAIFPTSPNTERSPLGNVVQSGNVSEAIVHANSLIQSLSKSSSVAHISSIGLKAIPSISHFTSLKSIDLSNNFIVQITPASLPKGLHALNLSKNKISVIEGLRDLTRLRVLDLSYNRISRIGQGLSNCTLIKELYLAGNKISNVEGLHRLLKLIVLDLSFNKIATTKAIGQLVANYNSLVALNILGNPIQNNVGEDQLRKTVSSLLPKLVYHNKQLIKPQRAREVLKDSVARAAFGGGDSLHHRRKRTSTKSVVGSASPSVHHRGHIAKGRGSKNRSQRQLRKTSAAGTPSH